MIEAFRQALSVMEDTFRAMERAVPPPGPVPYQNGYMLVYKEQSVQQALVMKLARQISGLYAIDVLVRTGLGQEQAVIQRTLDDIGEDIIFLSLGLNRQEWTPNHEKYLAHFWSQEAGPSTYKRDAIRSYVNRVGGQKDTFTANQNGKRLYQNYSAFVHATSFAIMETCRGDPPLYVLSGIIEGSIHDQHARDAGNYFYRGLISSAFVASAFKDKARWDECFEAASAFKLLLDSRTSGLAPAGTKG
ncbi:hypothetical protein C8J44_2392 [Sphingomonas sp. PP-CE-3A-406]|uniref:hypothetical protein n=1 Tax=Sphingomonas sp. PP-CE-3A-406 TaxID=2135659 RepID=UPI000EF9B37D|nr:hypothetical protein [Sphingomonas sp. PP-CE-3A-406]RMB54764.1 hypothetical protein C8J44_2392 [Sphingomonas sp. PP-CE-3A-406]